MNVGIVTPRYPPNIHGGGERSVQLLAEGLAAHSDISEVTVYTLDGHGTSYENNIRIRRVGRYSKLTEVTNFLGYSKLRHHLGENIDVVHSYNMLLHPMVGAYTYRHETPSVATLNSYKFLPPSTIGIKPIGLENIYRQIKYPISGRVELRLIDNISQLIGLSSAVINIYENNTILSGIKRIPNMYDPSFKEPDISNKNKNELLYVGGLRRTKGVKYLIQAMARLTEEYHLNIVGSGPTEQNLRNLTASLGLNDQITFIGKVPYEKVRNYYSSASVFVHPGIWPEPFNRTLLEAMQSGLPAVVTNVGGPPEVVPQEELICAPRSPLQLAKAIRQAEAHLDEYGEQNHNIVHNKYNPNDIIDQIVEIYSGLPSDLDA